MSFYLLRCTSGYYLGYTANLTRRLTEHLNGQSYNTILNKPEMLMGIYEEMPLLIHFIRTSSDIEDFLTERMLIEGTEIRGGKYTTKKMLKEDPTFSKEELRKYPLCNCKIPALLSPKGEGFVCAGSVIPMIPSLMLVTRYLPFNEDCGYRSPI